MLLLLASWLGRYPLVVRYVLFIIPLHLLFVSDFLAHVWDRWKTAAVGLSLFLVMINAGSVRYFSPHHVFRSRQETNPALQALAKTDQSVPLYLYVFGIPQYEFKTGYRTAIGHIPKIVKVTNQVI